MAIEWVIQSLRQQVNSDRKHYLIGKNGRFNKELVQELQLFYEALNLTIDTLEENTQALKDDEEDRIQLHIDHCIKGLEISDDIAGFINKLNDPKNTSLHDLYRSLTILVSALKTTLDGAITMSKCDYWDSSDSSRAASPYLPLTGSNSRQRTFYLQLVLALYEEIGELDETDLADILYSVQTKYANYSEADGFDEIDSTNSSVDGEYNKSMPDVVSPAELIGKASCLFSSVASETNNVPTHKKKDKKILEHQQNETSLHRRSTSCPGYLRITG